MGKVDMIGQDRVEVREEEDKIRWGNQIKPLNIKENWDLHTKKRTLDRRKIKTRVEGNKEMKTMRTNIF